MLHRGGYDRSEFPQELKSNKKNEEEDPLKLKGKKKKEADILNYS